MFKKIKGCKNENKQDIANIFKKVYERSNMEGPKIDIMVGNPVKAYNKTIYPIIEILTIGSKMQSFKGAEIFPIALVVEEQENEYVISLIEGEINPEELIEMKEKQKGSNIP